MDTNIWTASAVSNAILQGNPNLEMVLCNYLKAYIHRLGQYDINLQGLSSMEQLTPKVLEGIAQLEEMRKELLAVLEMFATSNHPALERYLPVFFQNLLTFYEERGINLYTGTTPDVLRNDHYRFFNQFLLISLSALLIDNRCFSALAAILHAKFKVFNRSFQMTRDVNFIYLQKYNYTLNQFLNTNSPKRISVTADYMRNYSGPIDFEKMMKADILLYYISLWFNIGDTLDPFWFPELSVYNRNIEMLPDMVSKKYFKEAKVLFGVDTVDEYKKLLAESPDPLQRNGMLMVPQLKVGLLYNTVGSVE